MLRPHWTCVGCDVIVYHADGGMLPMPNGWHDGLCIKCQREAARNGNGDGSMELLRQELQRGTPLKKAAQRAGVTQAAARASRTALIREGVVAPPSNNSPAAQDQRRAAVEAALRADPTVHDDDIATRIGWREHREETASSTWHRATTAPDA